MAEHPINGLMGVTMDKIRELVNSDTIIGEPVSLPDGTTILPVSKVTFGVATGGSDASISINLMWGYFLVVFAIAAAIFCAVFGMIQNPAGIKGTNLSLG